MKTQVRNLKVGYPRFEPIEETKNKDFQMDYYGNFRIRVKDENEEYQFSGWVPYEYMATLTLGTDIYIGVSEYHKGIIPVETVLSVTKNTIMQKEGAIKDKLAIADCKIDEAKSSLEATYFNGVVAGLRWVLQGIEPGE